MIYVAVIYCAAVLLCCHEHILWLESSEASLAFRIVRGVYIPFRPLVIAAIAVVAVLDHIVVSAFCLNRQSLPYYYIVKWKKEAANNDR